MTDQATLGRTLKKVAARYHSTLEITRAIGGPNELQQLCKLDSSAYGHCSIPYEQLLAWWQAYPRAITALFQQSAIQGAIEIWPLSPTVAQQLYAGQIKERDIPADQMRPYLNAPCAHWYFSGVMLQDMQRKTAAIKAILTGTLSNFVSQSHFQFPLTISALGYSKEGICLLRRFGFRKLQSEKAMPDRCPLFSLHIATWEDGVHFLRSRCLLNGNRKKRQPALALATC